MEIVILKDIDVSTRGEHVTTLKEGETYQATPFGGGEYLQIEIFPIEGHPLTVLVKSDTPDIKIIPMVKCDNLGAPWYYTKTQ